MLEVFWSHAGSTKSLRVLWRFLNQVGNSGLFHGWSLIKSWSSLFRLGREPAMACLQMEPHVISKQCSVLKNTPKWVVKWVPEWLRMESVSNSEFLGTESETDTLSTRRVWVRYVLPKSSFFHPWDGSFVLLMNKISIILSSSSLAS